MTASLSQSRRPADQRNSAQRSSEQRSLESVGLRPVDHVAAPTPSPLHLVSPEGQLQVHTAPYRGSFAGVLSQALRAAGLGSRVLVAQFLRGGVNQGPQGRLQLCGRLEWLRPEIEGCLDVSSLGSAEPLPGDEASAAVNAVWEVCLEHLLAGDLDHLVLDELGLAIALGYLREEDVLSTLEQRPGSMDVIVTGTSLPTNLISIADQVTELRRGF